MDQMNRHIRRFAVAGLVAVWALSGSGCSTATKFGYNHLDWFAKREIGKYFDLTQRQEDWFKPRFEALWLWHRHEQLPLYVADLRSLAEQAQQPLSREHITQALTMIQGHVRRTLERATPETVTLLAMLDDAQVASLLEEVDDNIAEAAEKLEDQTDEDRREDAVKRVKNWMEDRYGRLSDDQKALIEDWSRTRESRPAEWLDHSRRWRDAFALTLASRDEPGFAERAAHLLFDDAALVPEHLLALRQRNEDRWLDLAAAISAITTERQRAKLVDYISDFAKDFDKLAQQRRD
nr:DUF6279 family lipoprotein [Abyssibacter sp.]